MLGHKNQTSTYKWLGLPQCLGQQSQMIETMVSKMENWVPSPKAKSMVKNKMAQILEPGNRETASGYTMKAKPGPGEEKIYFIHESS